MPKAKTVTLKAADAVKALILVAKMNQETAKELHKEVAVLRRKVARLEKKLKC